MWPVASVLDTQAQELTGLKGQAPAPGDLACQRPSHGSDPEGNVEDVMAWDTVNRTPVEESTGGEGTGKQPSRDGGRDSTSQQVTNASFISRRICDLSARPARLSLRWQNFARSLATGYHF